MKVVSFNQVNVTLMRSKLFQLDEGFRNEIVGFFLLWFYTINIKQSTSSIAMYPNETMLLEDIFTYLGAVSGPPASKSLAPPTPAHIEAIISILERWPSSQRFPLIDLSRLVFAFCPKSPFDVPGLKTKFLDSLFVAAEWGGREGSSEIPMGKVRETNTTLVLKALANAVGEWNGGSEEIEVQLLSKVVEDVGKMPYTRLVKSQKVAFATVLFK